MLRTNASLLLALAVACGGSPDPAPAEQQVSAAEPQPPADSIAAHSLQSGYPVRLTRPGPYRIAARPDGGIVASRAERTLWLEPDGAVLGELDSGGHVAVDSSGNTVLAGELDGWVMKLDASRQPIWSRHLGQDARPRALALDDAGNVLVTGAQIGTRMLDAGDGSTRWLASPSGSDLAVDGEGNVTLMGGFIDDLDLFGEEHYSDQPGLFVLRLDARGQFLWSRVFSAKTPINGHAIATDAEGNTFVAGTFRGEVSVGGPLLAWRNRTEQPYEIGFVAKYDETGEHLVSRILELAETFEIATDAAGNLLVTGHPSDAEPLLDLRLLSASCEDVWSIRGPRGYGFDVAFDAGGAVFWSVDAQEGPVLSPWVFKLSPRS